MKKLLEVIMFAICLAPVSAFAQNPVDSLFDKVLQASAYPTCEETQKALENITDDEITLALKAIKDQKIQGDASLYEEKINKIIAQASKCPKAQDAFVTRMTKSTLMLQISQTPAKDNYYSEEQIKPALRWLDAVLATLNGVSCDDLSLALTKIDPEISRQAKETIRTLTPSRLTPKDKASFQEKMRAIYKAVPDCPNASQKIDTLIDGMFVQ
ncbi:MAG: hypothetical protein II767_03215 [Proteobacteria bacterium]|nr:hypothetical protein [Pseudomonadota bacterium]